MSGKITAHFSPLYKEDLRLTLPHLCILDIFVEVASRGEIFSLLVAVFILPSFFFFFFCMDLHLSYHKTPWVDLLG